MNFRESIAYLEQCASRGYVDNLNHMHQMMLALGHPEKDLKFIHVAGTNGKGSICSYLAHILQNSGLRVGLYVSPGLEGICSRVQVLEPEGPIQPHPMEESEVAACLMKVREIAENEDIPIVEFEALTLMALVYLQQQNVDIVVWEVGMGGRLDATNAIPQKELAVLANVGLDHTKYLGDTVEEIANEKADILRNAKKAVAFDLPSGVRNVVMAQGEKHGVKVRFADFRAIQPASGEEKVADRLRNRNQTAHAQFQLFSYHDWEDVALRMLGEHQEKNAATVLECVEALREIGWEIPNAAVRKAFRDVQTPLRLEWVESLNGKGILVDGAHNPQAVKALAETLQNADNKLFSEKERIRFVFGMLEGKDYKECIRLVLPLADCFYVVGVDSPRSMAAEVLAAEIRAQGGTCTVYCDVDAALRAHLDENSDTLLCAFGSFHVAQAAKDFVRRSHGARLTIKNKSE